LTAKLNLALAFEFCVPVSWVVNIRTRPSHGRAELVRRSRPCVYRDGTFWTCFQYQIIRQGGVDYI
jgi:hypothetical protein